jgi:hypothetical protein
MSSDSGDIELSNIRSSTALDPYVPSIRSSTALDPYVRFDENHRIKRTLEIETEKHFKNLTSEDKRLITTTTLQDISDIESWLRYKPENDTLEEKINIIMKLFLLILCIKEITNESVVVTSADNKIYEIIASIPYYQLTIFENLIAQSYSFRGGRKTRKHAKHRKSTRRRRCKTRIRR